MSDTLIDYSLRLTPAFGDDNNDLLYAFIAGGTVMAWFVVANLFFAGRFPMQYGQCELSQQFQGDSLLIRISFYSQ